MHCRANVSHDRQLGPVRALQAEVRPKHNTAVRLSVTVVEEGRVHEVLFVISSPGEGNIDAESASP